MARKIPEQFLGAMPTVVRNLLPASALSQGDLIFNQTTQTMQVWNGAVWLEVGLGGGLPNHKHTTTPNDGGNQLGSPLETLNILGPVDTAGPLTVLDGAGQFLHVPKLTTAERNALTADEGMIIYNTDTNQFERYQAGAWGPFGGGGGGGFNSAYLIYVAWDAAPAGDGSAGNPFNTIQAAINTIPEATDSVTVRRVYVVLIAPGSYDEDLNIDITRRRIVLLGQGPWNLGSFQGTFWAPAPPPFGTEVLRNINVTNTKSSIDSIRCALSIGTVIPHGNCMTSHPSYITGARISGVINFSSSVFADIEFSARAEIWHGIYQMPGFVGAIQMYLDRCRVRDNLSGVPTDPVIDTPNGRIQYAEYSRFFGRVNINRFSLIRNCLFENGMTVVAVGADLRPNGMFQTDFAGTFTGPANSARFDGSTNYYFKTNAAILAGGATKVILDDLVP